MKKLTPVLTAVAATISLLMAGSALAYTGQDPCSFQTGVMKDAGFVQGGLYNVSQIRQLFYNANVVPGRLASVYPGVTYRADYSCFVYNQTGHAKVRLVPIDKPRFHCPITTVKWLVTKPW